MRVVKVPATGNEIRLVLSSELGEELLLPKGNGEVNVLVKRLANLDCCTRARERQS